jgi:N-terminal domain of anti-restriction factor ArdC
MATRSVEPPTLGGRPALAALNAIYEFLSGNETYGKIISMEESRRATGLRLRLPSKQGCVFSDRRDDSEVSMKDQAKWQELLVEAVNEPGKIMMAYTAFHNYSMGNALLALSQCVQRKLTPGPLNTFKGWQELGRHVKKGERALTLCMPVTAKKKRINPESKVEEEQVLRYFVYRPNWFVLSQTDGDTPYVLPTPGFEFDTALNNLDIRRLEFDIIDGNVQGFARDRGIAINPVAQLPHKTTFHELAHIVLGHTQQAVMVESDATPRCIREVEAESVALICCEALGLPGIAYCRGYLQFWLRDQKEIPAHSAQRIFCAATAILKAGSEARS